MLTSLLRVISKRKNGLARWLRDEAAMYIRFYDDFSYDFETNGEKQVLQALAPFSMRTIFDVGANVGEWSRVAASILPDSTVHAFELSERTRSILKANLAGDRFVVPDLALGEKDGEIEYKDYGDGSTINTTTQSTFHDRTHGFSKRVARVAKGDSYLAALDSGAVDMLKIDVEGAEYSVLKGFETALKEQRVRVIQFEYGYANGDTGYLMKSIYEMLGAAGYDIGRIWTAGVDFRAFEYRMNNFHSGPNYLAVSRQEAGILNALRSAASSHS